MSEHDARRLERQLARLSGRMPRFVGWVLDRHRDGGSRWIRIPVGGLLVVGGFAGFLPVLGFWMVPVGLVLLARDIRFLQRPVRRVLVWSERRYLLWKAGRRNR
ncbi:MAG: tryptophan synthase subunit beta [Amaricoccus sp.]